MAAFMAVAHAKFTGEIGVGLSTGGPGATHLITGLYDAKLDQRLFSRFAVRLKQLSELPARTQPRSHVRRCGCLRARSLGAGPSAASDRPMHQGGEGEQWAIDHHP